MQEMWEIHKLNLVLTIGLFILQIKGATFLQKGIEIVDRYNMVKNQIELVETEVSDLREQLTEKENELEIYKNQFATLKSVAPKLIEELEKEYVYEIG